jgi:uncharacterized protein YkwD
MHRFPLVAITLLAACSGSSSPEVLSSGEVKPLPSGADIISDPPDDSYVGDVSFNTLLNDTRADYGVVSISPNKALASAAYAHALDMEQNNYLSHTGLDGSTPGDRADAAGYNWDFIAENIASGFHTETGVMHGWMSSQGHKDNILDPRADDFGLGRVDDTWVLMLGSEF